MKASPRGPCSAEAWPKLGRAEAISMGGRSQGRGQCLAEAWPKRGPGDTVLWRGRSEARRGGWRRKEAMVEAEARPGEADVRPRRGGENASPSRGRG